jgi:acetate kinase
VNVLALNAGSSSLKFGLYQIATRSVVPLLSGIVEPIGEAKSEIRISKRTQALISETIQAAAPSQAVEGSSRRILEFAAGEAQTAIDAVGCRVVHGGAKFVKPARVTASMLHELRSLEELASLHNPVDVAVLEQVQRSLPETPVFAIFDTSFHQTLPEAAFTYALPFELSDRYGLRRYGFHGISHAYVSRQLIEHLGRGPKGTRIITCHLGNGASVCALRDGASADISMGLTPMEGLVMGTRSGDVDPGLILYLIRTAGLTASEVHDQLNHQSGLLGLSAVSGDVRALEQAAREGNTRAELALAVFAYRTCKYIGAFAAALGGLDAIAFAGGIGEHSASMRRRICERLLFLGLHIDEERNGAATGSQSMKISADDGPVGVWMIPTNEEREIAQVTYAQFHKP